MIDDAAPSAPPVQAPPPSAQPITPTAAEAKTPPRPAAPPAPTPVATDSRTPAQIESDLSATRERMAATIDELQSRVTPSALAAQGRAKVKGLVVDEFGGVRVERIAVAGAVVIGLIVIRSLFRLVRG